MSVSTEVGVQVRAEHHLLLLSESSDRFRNGSNGTFS
jgi:hypothetical protein